MRLHLKKRLQRIAQLLLVIMLLNILQPITAFALTSGPSQPEAMSFQPVGMTDMVDLFTGDFKYNIPLLEVDGYPINLNYQSGSGMDDEASWVGLGWNLNVGSINRQVRGIPDDFSGDEIKTEHSTKKKVTVGGRVTATAEFKGVAEVGGSFSLGVFNDNYTGIGAEIGVNAGLSFGLNSGSLTTGMGVGILSNTTSGVDVTPYVSLSLTDERNKLKTTSASLSTSLTYNSRSGLKNLTLGQSFKDKGNGLSILQSTWSYNTPPVVPKIQVPYKSDYQSFSFSAGPTAVGAFFGIGGTGYKSVRDVVSTQMTNPGYGFLYADKGKSLANAVHDFIREKDNPIIPELPNLAMPIHTPDLFNYNSQKGSGQFRLFRATGILGDNQAIDQSENFSLGFDVGVGWIVHGGISMYKQDAKTITRKWTKDNAYASKGDFQSYDKNDPKKEHVYFRKVDEKVMEDEALVAKMAGANTVAVNISGKNAVNNFNKKAGNETINLSIEKLDRQLKQTNISYLTAKEAEKQSLNRLIKTYPFLSHADDPDMWGSFTQSNNYLTHYRTSAEKKDHHISEIIVTEPDNSRQVYGIPVYNLKQQEYSFAIGKASQYTPIGANGEQPNGPTNLALVDMVNGQVNYKKGIDEYYHVDHIAPHATSYLLTEILSPDYLDKTGDGVSDDDLGSAIKFNYSKLFNNYKWRTPYVNQPDPNKMAVTVNRGLLADPEDDKGSFVYGEKEIYYPQSIETKTHIAIFITADRDDALGVKGINGQREPGTQQKALTEIRLYAKGDLTVPIKVVKFAYGYLLCKDTPNAVGVGGKLTLTKVWFEYGKTTKGEYHPYSFTYHDDVHYQSMATDRWGTYKPEGNNSFGGFSNEEFPYSVQERVNKADLFVKAFQLKGIELPSGGHIEIGYEADDYAYVQNKKASVMQPILGFVGGNRPSGDLRDKRGLEIAVEEVPPPGADQTKWFIDRYLGGSNYIYTKSLVKFSTSNGLSEGQDNDYVSAYGKVESVFFNDGTGGKTATVLLETVTDKRTENPILFAAWQKMKNEYPRYAYPGFKNKTSTENAGQAIEAAVSAILNAAGNLSELKQNFYDKAYNRGYASTVFTNKCFVRLVEQSGHKIGGGLRVKYVKIQDEWQTMSGDNAALTGSYGQWYDYTTVENGKRISSGVATYEPAVGSDENSLRQPVFYSHKVKGGLSDMFELELPFGESLYPSASVGYRKVSIRDLEADTDLQQLDIEDESPRTGTVEQEFYTAKDFPVRVEALAIKRHSAKPRQQFSMFKSNSVEELVLSQGYSIELNDMHGKQKAVRNFNKTGTEINSTAYEYQVEDPKSNELRLKNEVDVIYGPANGNDRSQKGNLLKNKVIGRDIELVTDFREQEFINSGTSLNPGLDAFAAWIVPVILVYSISGENNEYRLFRSSVATKVIQNSGILKKVIKKEDGASTSTENLAYDGLTGEAIVTRTQNEFNRYLYAVNLPAYWMYDMMGGAYQNLGMVLSGVTINSSGEINSDYWDLLQNGDMLVDFNSNKRYWAVNVDKTVQTGSPDLPLITTYHTKILIDEDGARVRSLAPNTSLKVCRSAYNNKLKEVGSTLVCLENPVKNGKLIFANAGNLANYKVLNATYQTFGNIWPLNGEGEKEVGYLNENYPASFFSFVNGNAQTFVNSTRVEIDPSAGIGQYYNMNHPYFNNKITTCGVSSGHQPQDLHGFTYQMNVLEAGVYFLGFYSEFSGVNSQWLRIDGEGIFDYSSTNNFLKPIYLEAGKHVINFRFSSTSNTSPGRIGLEIYNNTLSEIIDTNKGNYNIVFSTSQLTSPVPITDPNINLYREINNETIWYRMYEHVYNPFVNGMLGNWRTSGQFVYQSKRNQIHLLPAQKNANVQEAGYFEHFFSPWTAIQSPWATPLNSFWVKSNQVTLYDKHGQELENKDALGRYRAAKFDFKGELPAAVANNAQNKDLYHDSFEDFNYQGVGSSKQRFKATTGEVLGGDISGNMESHTGNRSGKLLPDKYYTLQTTQHGQQHGPAVTYFTVDQKKQFQLIKNITGLYPNGFEPDKKEYVFSAWIKDDNKSTKINTLQLTYRDKSNVQSTTINPKTKAIVEGWKLIEANLDLTTLTDTNIEFIIYNNVETSIDDIRIYPKEAMVKTYAYHHRTFKLMAEMDENNFATFYEYDDEGQLVRIKKETERGIVTLKETRAVYRKKSL